MVLSWFRSDLKGRQQIVVVRGFRSAPSLAELFVPQVSVLGPILFVLYMTQLDDIFPVSLLATTLLLTTHDSNGHVHQTLLKVLFAE